MGTLVVHLQMHVRRLVKELLSMCGAGGVGSEERISKRVLSGVGRAMRHLERISHSAPRQAETYVDDLVAQDLVITGQDIQIGKSSQIRKPHRRDIGMRELRVGGIQLDLIA